MFLSIQDDCYEQNALGGVKFQDEFTANQYGPGLTARVGHGFFRGKSRGKTRRSDIDAGDSAIMTAMQPPAFFDAVPHIATQDPLAQTLGVAVNGIIEYSYLDAVKLTGHSCPTVAGAYLITLNALARLYPGSLPRRGDVRVDVCQRLDEGVAGVIASVAGLITGAANDGGFKGLAGKFSRRDLLHFGIPMQGELRFTRLDTGQVVELVCHPEVVPRPAGLKSLMQAALSPNADAGARSAFADAWQAWVRAILLEQVGNAELFTVLV